MSYEAKTDWKYDETVTEGDLNRIEQGIKEAHEKSTENEDDLATHLAEDATDAHNATNISFSSNEMQATNVSEGILEAFMLGNSTKQDLVDKLLLVDDSLPITHESSWHEVLDSVNMISTGKKWVIGELGLTDSDITVSGIPFKPSLVVIYSTTADAQHMGGVQILLGSKDMVFLPSEGASPIANYSALTRFDTYFKMLQITNGAIAVTNDGFHFRPQNTKYKSVKWIAFE